MTLISYAQNFEDVMLWRALKHIERGFYIDVGANDPVVDSVTKAFYERGWSGINIEPMVIHHADLQRERVRDINLCCAAGAENGEMDIWECEIRGWGTVEQAVIEQHISTGQAGKYHRVPVRRLADICAEYVTGEIHFLKIDVEGFEKAVIEGADFQRFRPWIVVAEALRPNSTEEIHQQWEGLLSSANYRLTYSDGINRFYLAKEHSELASKFIYPPNVFDNFLTAGAARADKAEARANEAESKLELIYLSRSWRLTRPLRILNELIQQRRRKSS